MDFSINKEPIGRLVFGMFEELAPKTVNNFREICVNGINGQSYAGSNIHRVIDKFIVQGERVSKKSLCFIVFIRVVLRWRHCFG